MHDPSDLPARMRRAARIEGQFRLRSGATATEYFDKYRFESDPVLLRAIAEAMTELLPSEVDALAGLELGGVPLATMLSQLTGYPTIFVRKRAKEYGTRQLAEGGEVAGKRLVVVEDVVTTGGQVIESTQALRSLGASIDTAVCAIDREAGGRDAMADIDLELRSLFTKQDLDGL
ncbi:MAG: orotate phosphoribosyltransferase [Gemmatimonadetes bacterium]|nr:orotate phosphoribosyltransferase [Gemmatimonadota bacterium]